MTIKIIYRDGSDRTVTVDEYRLHEGCLCLYMLHNPHPCTRYIPLDLIKEVIV